MTTTDQPNALETGDYVVTTYRTSEQTKEVCWIDHSAGDDWWYALNDGLLDVGPFPSEAAAIDDAVAALNDYHRVMGGRVRSIFLLRAVRSRRMRRENGGGRKF